MTSLLGCPLRAAAALAIAACCALLVRAETTEERHERARRLVQEALYQEIYGTDTARAELLFEATQLDGDYAAAMWHQGFVRRGDVWQRATDESTRHPSNLLVEYRAKRARMRDTAEGHVWLGKWCAGRQLHEQRRAHLERALQLEPDHPEARQLLGYRRVDGKWLTAKQMDEAREAEARHRAQLAKWSPRLATLRARLHHRNPRVRAEAAEAVRSIREMEAIPALEEVLSVDSEASAGLVVEVLGNLAERPADVSLIRHSVAAPWEPVRAAAARELAGRDRFRYVPTMLRLLTTPIAADAEVVRHSSGQLVHRHLLATESLDTRDLLVIDTVFLRRARPGANAAADMWIVGPAQRMAAIRDRQIAERNALARAWNERVFDALAAATGAEVVPTAHDWWEWWYRENEVYVSEDKPTRTTSVSAQVEVVETAPATVSADCLAAGTPVWTDHGQVAIESICVGDLVLAQDLATGELAYKPVILTTTRPPSRLVRIDTADESIEVSGGHPLWVSGQGWVKARALEPAARLHCIDGTAHVAEWQTSYEAESYNIVVADFHTCFVGRSAILSHDNTVREPTEVAVPGSDM
jgi:hypothetical protein